MDGIRKGDLPPRRERGAIKDFFGADLRRTKAREQEIRSIFEHLNSHLSEHGLKTGNFQLLVASSDSPMHGSRSEDYTPFFDIGLVSDSVFSLEDSLRDALVARAYFRSIVANPVGRIIREDFQEIGDAVGTFLSKCIDSKKIPWKIPRKDSPLTQMAWSAYGLSSGITATDQTRPDKARRMLASLAKDFPDPEHARAKPPTHDWWFVPDEKDPALLRIPVPQQDQSTYAALVFCALGEKLNADWKSNELKIGHWKPQWEEGMAHFLATRVMGLPYPMQKNLPLSPEALKAYGSLVGKNTLEIITRFKRGASLHEFF